MNKQTRTANSVDTKKENLPMASMFEEDAYKGMEQMEADDLALPFIRLLDGMSPQVKKNKDGHIEGAEPGMLFNTVTKKLYDGSKGINVLPCYYKREYIEWADRGKGPGAPIAVHPVDTDLINQTTRDAMKKDRLPNGNYLENTASYYVMVLDDLGGAETALITMARTRLKMSRQWNSMISGIQMKGPNGNFTPPMFSHIYNLTSREKEDNGLTWHVWDVAKIGPIDNKAIYDKAKIFADSVSKGDVQVKHGEKLEENKVPF